MKAVDYAQQCIQERLTQIANLENHITWYKENTKKVEENWEAVKNSLTKGGFKEIEWKKDELNRVNIDTLSSTEILPQKGIFMIQIEAVCKGYTGEMYSKSWKERVVLSLQKKKDRIQATLPSSFKIEDFYHYDFHVDKASEEVKVRFRLYTE